MSVLFNPLIGSYQVATTPDQSEPGNIGNEGARGVMVIVIGIRHGDTSSNPG